MSHLYCFYSSYEPMREIIVDDVHLCKKSMDLEIQVKLLTEKLNRSKALCKEKSNQIKKLNSLLGHYQKQSKTLKDIISNMKAQELISDQVEEYLNVSDHEN